MLLQRVQKLPYQKRILLFWIILAVCGLALLILWMVLDNNQARESVIGEIIERGKNAQDYWRQKLDAKK